MGFIEFINGIAGNIGLLSAFCLIAGFILVIVEMFHPGFGVPGAAGVILLILGVILTAKSITEAFFMMSVILTILCVVLAVVLHSATKGKLSKKLILREEQNKESGYIGTEDLNYFLGKDGIAITVLRPSGTADINGVKIDVVTEGEYIEKGSKIRIVKVQGRRIVVTERK